MKNIKDFYDKNKATIISVLSALLTFVVALSSIDMGAKVGIAVSILVVILPVIISIMGGKDMNTTINLLVNAITVIQQIVKDNQKKDDKAVSASKDGEELTEDEIRELITKGL